MCFDRFTTARDAAEDQLEHVSKSFNFLQSSSTNSLILDFLYSDSESIFSSQYVSCTPVACYVVVQLSVMLSTRTLNCCQLLTALSVLVYSHIARISRRLITAAGSRLFRRVLIAVLQVTMSDRSAAERACKDPNPIIDGRKTNVNLAYLGAKPRILPGRALPGYNVHASSDLLEL